MAIIVLVVRGGREMDSVKHPITIEPVVSDVHSVVTV
jgi:hypothetical protein